MTRSLLAVRASLSPLRVDRVQMLQLQARRLEDIRPPEAMVMRLARHAGSAEDLALRFAEAAMCPPELGQREVQAAISHKLLEPVDALPGQETLCPPSACPDGEAIGDPDAFNRRRELAGSQDWLMFDPAATPLSLPAAPGAPLIAQHLEGLEPLQPQPWGPPLEPLTAAREALAQAATQHWQLAPALAEGRWLRPLIAEPRWLGLCLHRRLALAGPVISDGAACRPGYGQCLLLQGGRWLPPLHELLSAGYGAVLRYLFPAGKMLHVGTGAPPETTQADATTEAARAAILAAPPCDPRASLASRVRLLAWHLNTLADSDSTLLQQELTAAWLADWSARDSWQAVYGLDPPPVTLPDFRVLDLPGLRSACREYARQLQQELPRLTDDQDPTQP